MNVYEPDNLFYVTVKLNGQYLTNSAFYYNGQFVAVDYTVTILTNLTVGDEIEVETNQLVLTQTLLIKQLQPQPLHYLIQTELMYLQEHSTLEVQSQQQVSVFQVVLVL